MKSFKNLTPEGSENLLIIDGNSLAYRWFNNSKNMPNNYISTIYSFASSFKAKEIIVCFDYGKSKYRKELLPEYKANRVKPTEPDKIQKMDEFYENLNKSIELIRETRFIVQRHYGIEADDLIYYLKGLYKNLYKKVYIISSDKDLFQLLDENTIIFSPYHSEERDIYWLAENIQCTPNEYLNALIISGDTSDNIQGVKGLGEPKNNKARSLIWGKTGNNISEILKNAKTSKSSSIFRQRLIDSEKLLKLNEKLIDLSKIKLEESDIQNILKAMERDYDV